MIHNKKTDIKLINELRPIDDTLMQKLGEDREFCEEMLRIILNKPKLKVISNSTQKALHNIDTRSVTVDIKCMDEDGTIFSVEVQKSNDDDHQKRVRYNGACVQIQSLQKGANFKELPDVCMIFITERDFLGKNKTIYHIDRLIRETGEIINNGYSEIYVNTEIDDKTDLAEYMKLLKSPLVHNNSRFPVISRLTAYYKNGEGREIMCDVVKNYAEECVEERVIEIAKRMYDNGADVDFISKTTGLTVSQIEEICDLQNL